MADWKFVQLMNASHLICQVDHDLNIFLTEKANEVKEIQKENELLKKENESLKKEIKELKTKIEESK